eukprot:Skav234276  [mRNA]  locus=scaffold1464:1189955:1191136:+ [translate_table: standard]
MPDGLKVGEVKKLDRYEKQALSATIIEVLDTSNDLDPERIKSLKSRLKENDACDALVLELPQIWIISDPEFRAKSASIGLYPGSFWMGFLKSWGAVKVAEVFFKKSPGDAGREPMVSVAVQFREQENLRMCFTYIHDRYLVHPKQKNALRQPWGRLVAFEDYKAKTLGRPAQKKPKAAARQLQINRPLAPKQGPQGASAPASKEVPPEASGGQREDDHQLTPAEAMVGMSGRHLEAFQAVIGRVNKLERENKELIQVLMQMQGLLQQSQQRNEQLAGIARADPATNSTARVALEAQRQAMMAAPMPPAVAPGQAFSPQTQTEQAKRSAETETNETETNENEEATERPWKHQRRRQRRTGDGANAGAEVQAANDADPSGGYQGLAAYHNALLGV